MNIVKTMKSTGRPYREWGLGDDGELYSRFVGTEEYEGYDSGEYDWESYVDSNIGISLREMKEIVKAFGHLVIYT